MIYFCCDEGRRAAVARHDTLKGIDFLEVATGQHQLRIHFVPSEKIGKSSVLSHVGVDNVRITGGERITSIRIIGPPAFDGDVLVVTVDDDGVSANGVGDFSAYTLELINVADLDPLLSSVDFSFKVECPSDFDCLPSHVCPPGLSPVPDINYLARDYASFRHIMLDRITTQVPNWTERNPADAGVVLVELLAYVGDHLSYRQDAIATEAYLGTARRRSSVRRHARLVDYYMHEGANARAWVQVQVSGDNVAVPQGTPVFSRVADTPVRLEPGSRPLAAALLTKPVVFETMRAARLFEVHNDLRFYTWESRACCLPKGATRATLRGHLPNLKPGDVLIFEELIDPQTQQASDANPAHRHAVRLTYVVAFGPRATSLDPFVPLTDPLTDRPITEVAWSLADALPFALCVSAKSATAVGDIDVSAARGNIVLVDHGQTIAAAESLGSVPASPLQRVPPPDADCCHPEPREPVPVRFRPQLAARPLTFAIPFRQRNLFTLDFQPSWPALLDTHRLFPELDQQLKNQGIGFRTLPVSVWGQTDEWSIGDDQQTFCIRLEKNPFNVEQLNVYEPLPSANGSVRGNPAGSLPAITSLVSTPTGKRTSWMPRHDLLDSQRDDEHFVVEMESDGAAKLRFGDNQHGVRPAVGMEFKAVYRTGHGAAGNVGREALAHLVLNAPLQSGIVSVRNPLPATGGIDPESIERVRQDAPSAFRRQERAVTEGDYAEVAQRHPDVQRAAATIRWTGSWHTVFLTVDRFGGRPVDANFEAEMRRHMEKFRMAGYDLEVDGPRYVSLEIELHICVLAAYFRSSVKAALLEIFNNRLLPAGRRGVFHPDNFSFGEPVYLSRLIAAAQAVAGVESVRATTFQRQGVPSVEARHTGQLSIGRLEIARLDNDRNFPNHGVFRLALGGGK